MVGFGLHFQFLQTNYDLTIAILSRANIEMRNTPSSLITVTMCLELLESGYVFTAIASPSTRVMS